MQHRSILLLTLAIPAAITLPTARAEMQILEGKAERLERGDMLIPITATGVVAACELVELKAKASGRVEQVYVGEGQMVKTGAVLLRLDPADEQRTVERLQADLDRVTANHDQFQIRLREAQQNRPLDVQAAQSLVDQARAVREGLQIEVDKLRQLSPEAKNEMEDKKAQAALNSANAALAGAEVELQRAKNYAATAIAAAQDDVVAADALLRSARKQLDDAKQRLTETTITSPLDGMIYSIGVRKGETIQSGTSGFTGGTVLLDIANVSKMYVIAQVDQGQIGPVRRMSPEFAQPGKARSVSDPELFASAPLPAGDDPLGALVAVIGAKPPPPVTPPAAPNAVAAAAVAANNALATPKPAAPAASPTASAPAVPVAPPAVAVVKAPTVPQGRRVKIRVESYPDETFEGVIERILPEPRIVAGATYFEVRIRVLGQDVAKLLSLQVDVQFTSERKKNVLKLPNDALVTDGKESFVYVPFRETPDEPEGEKRVRVTTGRTDGAHTELLSGLKQGDRVWTIRPPRPDADQP